MDASPVISRSAPTDASREALDFVHRLLTSPVDTGSNTEPADLRSLLGELARAFRGTGAGLAPLPEGTPVIFHSLEGETPAPGERWPWQEDAGLVRRVEQESRALSIPWAEGGSVLATSLHLPGPAGWLLWLVGSLRPAWTDAEAASLTFVGQVLERRLTSGPNLPRWAEQWNRAGRQHYLEYAARVARRLTHDYGNVLTGVLGFTELSMSQLPPGESPLRKYLGELHRSVLAGVQLTDQWRLVAGRQVRASLCAPLEPALATEHRRLVGLVGERIALSWDVPTDLPLLAMDGDNLRRVLTALLDNAREAIDVTGSITVSARAVHLVEGDCLDWYGNLRPGPHVEIAVCDTGCGLSPEVEARLFVDLFFTSKQRLRGLGLATTYAVLHAHRGGLRLEPGSERGLCARLAVPVAAPPAVASPTASAQPDSRRKVLVVDDDPLVLQIVRATLERAGYRVEAVSSGEEALQSYATARTDPFHLVLSDVLMPRVTGVDLAERLLRHDPNVCLLFMSGQVTPNFAHDVNARRFEFLPKPFRPDSLLEAVRKALHSPRKDPP